MPGNGSPTWKIIAIATVTLIFALLSYMAQDMRAEVQLLKESKVDRAQYQTDIRELKSMVRCIYNWHVPDKYRMPDTEFYAPDKGK
jgi:hypothetical protein